MNRAQRRMAARTAPQTDKRPASGTDEETIQRIIREQQAAGRGLAGIMADYSEAFRREAQTREIVKNAVSSGILDEELKKARESGFREGFQKAGQEIIRCCYAGICIALHDEFGFGAERCYRAVKACDEKVKYALHHSELVEELIRKAGLKIDWKEPFDRVQRADKTGE